MLQRDQDLLILQIDTHRQKFDNAASSTFRILLQVQAHDLGFRTEINHVFMNAICFKVHPFPFSISCIFFFYLQAPRDLTAQCRSWCPVRTFKIVIPYILESNPHPFYSFRGLKSQMWIRIVCGLDSRSRSGFWKKKNRAAVRAVRTIQ